MSCFADFAVLSDEKFNGTLDKGPLNGCVESVDKQRAVPFLHESDGG